MSDIHRRIKDVQSRIQIATLNANRPENAVQLLAVSKTKPATAVAAAYSAGLRNFGENYLQEATEKIATLSHLDIVWHFIGPIQSNKTRAIAQNFAWCHSVDRLKVARRLSEQRPPELPPLNICLQLNIDDEASKSGVNLDQLPQLARDVAQLPGVRLRGLMCIPTPAAELAQQRRPFRRVAEALATLQADGLPLDTLSMGMSGDLEAAILEGATVVRVGTDIFGARTDPSH